MLVLALVLESAIALALGLWLAVTLRRAQTAEGDLEAAREASQQAQLCSVKDRERADSADILMADLSAANDKLANDLREERNRARRKAARAERVAAHAEEVAKRNGASRRDAALARINYTNGGATGKGEGTYPSHYERNGVTHVGAKEWSR